MKKVTLILAALALVLGISQCKKQEKPVASGETQHIVLTASNGNDGSKVNVSSAARKLNLTWESNDKITVTGAVEGTLDFTGEAGSSTAKFEGIVTIKTGNQVVFTVGGTPSTYMEQDGTLAGLKGRIHLKATSEYKPDGNYGTVRMELQYAVLKLDLSAFALATGSTVVTINAGEEPVASVTGITSASTAVYVALPADGTGSKKYTFNNGNGMNAEKTWTLAANTFYTKSGSTTGEAIVIPAYPVGALPGLFSVSDNNQVYFSKGNLQYCAAESTSTAESGANVGGTWRFAEHQFDFIGDANANVAQTYYGWIDLFGWGTSGYNHNNKSYQPWSTSQTSNDYYAYGKQNNCLYDGVGEARGKADWGANAISNGGGSTWRTLTSGENGEWNYLINTRKVNGETGYGNTCVLATVEGVSGLIIFHDDYKDATDNLTSIPEGCVFLPAAGYRSGTSVGDVGSGGYYWSSSYGSSSYGVYGLGFGSGSAVDPSYYHTRYDGFSVRLVSEN